MSYFQATGARAIIKVFSHQYRWLAGGYDLETLFLEEFSLVVPWWIVFFFAQWCFPPTNKDQKRAFWIHNLFVCTHCIKSLLSLHNNSVCMFSQPEWSATYAFFLKIYRTLSGNTTKTSGPLGNFFSNFVWCKYAYSVQYIPSSSNIIYHSIIPHQTLSTISIPHQTLSCTIRPHQTLSRTIIPHQTFSRTIVLAMNHSWQNHDKSKIHTK